MMWKYDSISRKGPCLSSWAVPVHPWPGSDRGRGWGSTLLGWLLPVWSGCPTRFRYLLCWEGFSLTPGKTRAFGSGPGTSCFSLFWKNQQCEWPASWVPNFWWRPTYTPTYFFPICLEWPYQHLNPGDLWARLEVLKSRKIVFCPQPESSAIIRGQTRWCCSRTRWFW